MVAFLFLAAGIFGFVWALSDHSVEIGGVSVTLICLGMYFVREIRQEVTQRAKDELAKANHAAECARIDQSGSE